MQWMQGFGLIIFVLAATAAGAATPCSIHPKSGATDTELAAMAKVSMADARKAALASLKDASKATVEDEDLEVEDGCLVYTFDIVIKGKPDVEIQVDAGTGKVLSSKQEKPGEEKPKSIARLPMSDLTWRTLAMDEGMKDWPPKPGLTDMTRTRSRSSSTHSIASGGQIWSRRHQAAPTSTISPSELGAGTGKPSFLKPSI